MEENTRKLKELEEMMEKQKEKQKKLMEQRRQIQEAEEPPKQTEDCISKSKNSKKITQNDTNSNSEDRGLAGVNFFTAFDQLSQSSYYKNRKKSKICEENKASAKTKIDWKDMKSRNKT